jgi:PAS domain S-box-containing protein
MDASVPAPDARFLPAILESSKDAILLVDRAGRLRGWNRAAERMFDVPPEHAPAGSLPELLVPERREANIDLLRRTAPGEPARATTVAHRKDGTRLIVELACSAVDCLDGDPSHYEYVVVLRDVTEPMLVRSAAAAVAFEADASAALESLTRVLGQIIPVDNLTLTAVERGAARRVASAGRAGAKLHSGEIVPLVGSGLGAAISLRQPVVCLDTRVLEFPHDAVLANAGIRSYVTLPLFHGGRVVASLNVGFGSVGVPTPGVVDLLRSLTASVMPIVLNLVTVEEQAAAIRRLEELDALKNEFLALIAHDMRTPLAIIVGFAEHLQSRWSEVSDAEKLEGVDSIVRNGRHLYRLVEDGLEVARIEAGDFDYQVRPLALEEEVGRTVADLATAGADRIRVTAAAGLPKVRCDPDRHWRILTNLLSNALKFSPPETTIEVKLTQHDSVVQVAVRDHGPGIDGVDLPKLFQKFSRVGNPDQLAVPGYGLGLYISKATVEAQGGTMSVRSKPGEGSTFTYTLPVAEDAAG